MNEIDKDQKPKEEKKAPPWYVFGLTFKGKKETDPEFNKFMSSKWSLVGLKGYKTIIGSTYAWCGLSVAVVLAGVGVKYQMNGAGARNWQKYGIAIEWKTEGIPQGAIVQINHNLNCGPSSGNHVAMANGDCSPEDLLKDNATLDLYGGNQGDTFKVSTYSAKEICAVRWPDDAKYPKPEKITKSVNCTSAKKDNESTQ